MYYSIYYTVVSRKFDENSKVSSVEVNIIV